jgi:flagellar biosynthesis protein FlhA
MMTTHLSELLRQYAHELVGRQEVQELLSVVSKDAPKLVEDTVPGQIGLGELVRIVRGLLREGLSVRDLRTVLEAVGDAAPRSKDVPFLVEQVRRRLTRQITSRFADPQGVVHAISIDHPTEDLMRQSLGNHDGEVVLNMDLDLARRLIQEVEAKVSILSAAGHPGVVMAPPELRRPLFDLLSRFVGEVAVISARELVTGTTVVPAGTIQLSPVPPTGAPRARAAA